MDSVDPRTGESIRTYGNGGSVRVAIEQGPKDFGIARLENGEIIETEMPNLTVKLIQEAKDKAAKGTRKSPPRKRRRRARRTKWR